METLKCVGKSSDKSSDKSSELIAIERLANDIKHLTEKVVFLENKALGCCCQPNNSALHRGSTSVIAPDVTLGMVLAWEVSALSPTALQELDAGIIRIADMLVPSDSAPRHKEETAYQELLTLFAKVRLRIAVPIGPWKPYTAAFDTITRSRNQRLEDNLLSWRSWATRNTGMTAYETLYQLIKFRGIDLNE